MSEVQHWSLYIYYAMFLRTELSSIYQLIVHNQEKLIID